MESATTPADQAAEQLRQVQQSLRELLDVLAGSQAHTDES
jgi:hypothetical protein